MSPSAASDDCDGGCESGGTTGPPRSRSVVDFETERSLRAALRDCTRRGSLRSFGGASGGGGSNNSNCQMLPHVMFEEEDSGSDVEDLSATAADLSPEMDWVTSNLDPDSSVPQTVDEELHRLQTLKSYLILDNDREASFERITALASRIFNVPIALVSLVDLGRQWFLSNRGLGDVRETPRNLAFCAHCVQSTRDLLIVPNATQDRRFATNPLVTGPPNIRFYAGAPLVCPTTGYRLGTLCLIDVRTRPALSLDERQNLRELANMVVDTLVQRRRDKLRLLQDKSKFIACTAHDLLTPLSGVQLSLSLLLEDEKLRHMLDENQRELVQTAGNCSDVMGRMCHQAIRNFRGDDDAGGSGSGSGSGGSSRPPDATSTKKEGRKIVMSKFLHNLRTVMEPYPKSVPLVITVSKDVPSAIVLSDDLKLFRSAVNYLTNAFKVTTKGCVKLKIHVTNGGPCDGGKNVSAQKGTKSRSKQSQMLVFECEDTGPGVNVDMYDKLFMPFRDGTGEDGNGNGGTNGGDMCSATTSSGLGLFSVASNIGSLGGEYGFRPRKAKKAVPGDDNVYGGGGEGATPTNGEGRTGKGVTGSIFWFSIPLVVPAAANTSSSSSISAARGTPGKGEGKTSAEEKKKEMVGTEQSHYGQKKMEEVEEEKKDSFKNETNNMRNEGDGQDDVVMNSLRARYGKDTAAKVENVGGKATATQQQQQQAITQPKLQQEGTAEAVQSQPQPPQQQQQQRARRALVIDDSIVIRKSIDRALTKLGFECTQATNGMEGLAALQSNVHDVVLCDFLMPVMDGLDCVQQYRMWETNHRPWFQQYIIGISAHASDEDVKKGIDVGMNDFIPKPVRLQVLKELKNNVEIMEASQALDDALNEAGEEMDALGGSSPGDDGEQEVVVATKVREENVASNDGADATTTPTTTTLSRISSSGPACLIAEDSTTVSKVLVRAVESRGWQALVVTNGEEALSMMKLRNWDAVFLDDEMPRLTGTKCVLQFREWEHQNRIARQNHVYLLSGNFLAHDYDDDYDDDNDNGSGVANVLYPSGFDGCLGKPVALNRLYKILDTVGKNKRGECKSSEIL